MWSSNGTELERMNNVSSTTMDNSLVYTDSYIIVQLSTTDNSRRIQCEVVINTSPSVLASDSITLDVTGEYDIVANTHNILCNSSPRSSHSYSHHITIWSHTRSYGG